MVIFHCKLLNYQRVNGPFLLCYQRVCHEDMMGIWLCVKIESPNVPENLMIDSRILHKSSYIIARFQLHPYHVMV